MGLVLSMVRSSPAIKQVYIARLMMWVLYNEQTNCLCTRVQARSFTNRLHGKAAERAVHAY